MTTEVANSRPSYPAGDDLAQVGPADLHAAAVGLRSVAEQLNTELDLLIRKASDVGVPWSGDDLGERISDAYRSAERLVIECVESNLDELRGFGDDLAGLVGSGAGDEQPSGLAVPAQLEPLLAATGVAWPESDELGIVELSRRWHEFPGPLLELVATAEAHREVVEASDTDDVAELHDEYSGPESSFENLRIAVHGVELCATILESCATAVLATKLAMVAVLAGHAARVAQAQAAAERTLGASLAAIPAHAEVTRLHLERLLSLVCDYIDAEGEFDNDGESDEADESEADESDVDEDDEEAGDDTAGEPVSRVEHRSDFPESWSPQQRTNAIQRAFRGGQRNKDAQFWWGTYQGVRVEGYYDPATNKPVVAYPGRMAPKDRHLSAADRVAFYYDDDLGLDFGCPEELDSLAFWVTSDLATTDACLDALAGAADIRNRVGSRWEMVGNIWQARLDTDGTLHLNNEWNSQTGEYSVDDVVAVLGKYWRFIASDPDDAVTAVVAWELAHDRTHPQRDHLADRQIVVREPTDAAAAEAIRAFAAARDHTELGGAGLDFRGADLRGLTLRSATFAHAQLDRVDLRQCQLQQANLTGASAYGAVFDNADLEDANLRNLSAPSASFEKADLTEADAPYAYLRAANLRGAYLFDTNLAFATLTDADLTGAHLTDARLLDCHLEGAVLTDVTGSIHGPVYVEPDNLLAGPELAAWFRDKGATDIEVLP